MRGSALLDLILFLLVSPLAHSFKGSEISKFYDKSISNQISQSDRESGYVLVSTVDGSISLVDMSSQKLDWTFHTNEPIYSSYQAPHYHYTTDEERSSVLGDDFYMDCDKDWRLYNSSVRKGKRVNEIVDASEFIGTLPYTSTDRIVLGKKDTSVFLLDWKTGKLVKRYRMDELYSNTVVENDKEKAIVLSKEAPLLFGSGFKKSEDFPELVYIERKDFKIQCISKFGDVLWSVSYAKMEAKLQNHESVQFISGLSSSVGKNQFPLSYTTSVPMVQLRNVKYETLFPRLGFLDEALYLPFQDRKPNQLAIGDGNQLTLPGNKEAEEVLSLPLPETVISQITDIIDGSTKQAGFASKFSGLIVLIFGFCVTMLSVCGLFFYRLRQSIRIKEPYVSEVPIATPKKKKSKKNGTTKAVHKKENGFISGGNKDPSHEENEKRLLTAFPGLNNSSAEGYRVGKLFVSNKEIAKGSNGTVVLEGSYEGRLVAVKRLVQSHHDVAQKEILNLMASDKHSNIVRWYGVDQDEHFIYISLELCACSLNDLIYASSALLESPMASSSIHSIQINPIFENGKGVELWKENGHPSPVLLKLMRDIVAGLVHLHDIGIVHRDLKPQNVLIVKNSSLCAKLSDMGISKRLPADTSALTRNSTGLGSGSSGWQAPEQLRNERQTRAVDLFSLGCVLFFCMTGGKHPYGDNYERDVNVLNDQKDLFLIESLPEAVHLLTGLLNPDPNLRPRAQDVMHHPLFWNSDMRLSFLRDASDRVELENREEGSQLLAALESTAAVTLNGRWDEKLDSIFLDNIGRYRRYKFDSIRDLLRVIRNKLNHYRELPKELQELLGSVPEGFERYFSSRFPKLLIQVYTVLFDYCNNEEFFFKYSKTTVF
ncbi:inositol requiring 1-1 [Arabidopsis thaliana]|jgi:serine/threonine-protein kinase/endoribonuclease IRE1|uniref:Serine/threonine-protein kinase/endoribonuclease IRE1b n=1 Tax=Arabidopsis thaliana TaxID=3702 RepID=IRE1B_ARATH|nr:inositol requiring 1-1 [Arabidopsis thaliana]Q93VJ2.1 RecName: Full=Serine/threonine-protein kinase/endoribonuclease IRE1b; AltName: Full=Endoplasmic reticulum-to-nucleus signaling 1-1; AltName: Full=Inositol-requiring protein 1-1; Short=AtIRE1-1; AltName: Full=Serine/threonine-protein kinase/endoribonuclease IRE1-1; Includes: RecName: Full=Serine/threonine-protein kinase; Includes: RecName: Full=Endoribonuclease; Flags: Precursor [Arabidopsis thaliana]AAL09714.1 AT5g24360/K16H17_7 [Arabidopsi|eukprot:NP_568444.1 inositol requiring 1-1 [Arabidopsis thaliana]